MTTTVKKVTTPTKAPSKRTARTTTEAVSSRTRKPTTSAAKEAAAAFLAGSDYKKGAFKVYRIRDTRRMLYGDVFIAHVLPNEWGRLILHTSARSNAGHERVAQEVIDCLNEVLRRKAYVVDVDGETVTLDGVPVDPQSDRCDASWHFPALKRIVDK